MRAAPATAVENQPVKTRCCLTRRWQARAAALPRPAPRSIIKNSGEIRKKPGRNRPSGWLERSGAAAIQANAEAFMPGSCQMIQRGERNQACAGNLLGSLAIAMAGTAFTQGLLQAQNADPPDSLTWPWASSSKLQQGARAGGGGKMK